MVRAEGQEQELANEMSESLEWRTGTMKVPGKRAWAMALDKQQLLTENDFGKLLNVVVADGQTLHIVFLLTYGAESVRVLLDVTNGNCGMRVESTALNEEEIMFWLTLKRSNTISILTAVMVPHVVAAWLDIEERDARKVWVKGMGVHKGILVFRIFSKRCQKNVLVPRTFRM